MTKPLCASYCDGECGMDFDEYDEDTWPSSMDEQGLCLDDGEERMIPCTEFFVEEEVCDYCGEPLGFCAIDCETREPDFEE